MRTPTDPRTAERNLTRWMSREVFQVTVWVWPGAVVVAAVVMVLINRATTVTGSGWEQAGHWPRWFLFAMAITVITKYLPIAVAQGLTRRAVLRATARAIAVSAVAWAAFMTAGHVVERLLYGAAGWTYAIDNPHLFDGPYDVLPMLAEYTLFFAVYMAAGVLAAGAYLRLGGWLGTAALPLTLSPIVAVEALLSTGWVGALLQDAAGIGRAMVPVVLTGGVALLLLTAAATWLILRDIPLRPRTA